MDVFARGQRKSRLTSPASTLAHREVVVDKQLLDVFEGLDMRGRRVAACAMWCSGRLCPELGVKKQTDSDCDLRNFRSVDDGAGVYRAGLIADNRLSNVCYEIMLLSWCCSESLVWNF